MVHCGPHSHPDSGHQEMERGGVEVTESSQMMNIPFQLTYHEPEINFMLISNLKGSQRWKCILSWGWPCLHLKMESFIALETSKSWPYERVTAVSAREPASVCELTESSKSEWELSRPTVWGMVLLMID